MFFFLFLELLPFFFFQRLERSFGKFAFPRSLTDVIVLDEWNRKWICKVTRSTSSSSLSTSRATQVDYYLSGEWCLLCMCMGLKPGDPIRLGVNKDFRGMLFLSRSWFS